MFINWATRIFPYKRANMIRFIVIIIFFVHLDTNYCASTNNSLRSFKTYKSLHSVLFNKTCIQLQEIMYRIKINRYLSPLAVNSYTQRLERLKSIAYKLLKDNSCDLSIIHSCNSLRSHCFQFYKALHDNKSAKEKYFLIQSLKRRGNRNHMKTEQYSNRLSKLVNLLRKRREATQSVHCSKHWLGDGLCDLGCNSHFNNYDNGDCCYDTCIRRIRFYPCGITGYQCTNLNKIVPLWFTNRTELCFRYESNGDKKQCGSNGNGIFCAPVGSMTPFYFDDTDKRKGGCLLSWSIMSLQSPEWFQLLRVCYRFQSENNKSKCNGSSNSEGIHCALVNHWTTKYKDSTDDVSGSCNLSWKIDFLNNTGVLPSWTEKIRFCFYWFSDNNDEQCGSHGVYEQFICAKIGHWTPYFRDNTNDQDGGCHLAWSVAFD